MFKRILEEVGFICEGFRFRVVSKNVISTLTVLHPVHCPGLVAGGSCAKVWALHILPCCSPGSSSSITRNTMFSWNLSSASCLNLDLLPESVTSVLVLEFVHWCEFHLCGKGVEFCFVRAKKHVGCFCNDNVLETSYRSAVSLMLEMVKSQLFIYQQLKLCLLWLVEHHMVWPLVQEEKCSHECNQCFWSRNCLSLDPNQKKLFSLWGFG